MAKIAAGAKQMSAARSTGKRSAAKKAVSAAKKPGAASKAAAKKIGAGKMQPVKRYRVAGTTSDGVVVLHSAVKPTHFTSDEIRQTIREYLRQK